MRGRSGAATVDHARVEAEEGSRELPDTRAEDERPRVVGILAGAAPGVTERCRSCDRAVSAPRVERARLVWVCARCADRTDVACAHCATPLTDPQRSSDGGFRAWCKPCGVAIQLDATATEQRRLVPAPPPAPPVAEAPPELDASPAAPPPDVLTRPAPPARSQALEITTAAAAGADFRNADRLVSIVCRPREGPREAKEPVSPWMVAAAVLGASAMFVLVVGRGTSFGPHTGVALLGLAVAAALGAFVRRRPEPLPAETRLRIGPGGLEVARDGAPAWRIDASRVERVFADTTDEGVIRVRVQLEDGTPRELVAGLTEEEASEVVAHVDRALPGRQADR